MVRPGVLASLLFLFACSDSTPDRNRPNQGGWGWGGGMGQGGEGGSVPSDGGSGGTIPPDETPPTIELQTPDADQVVDDPYVIVEGVATDESGVTELSLKVGERAVPVEYVPGPEVHFRIPLELAKGDNLIRLEAVDGAGNRSHVERTVNWPNAPGRPPVIEAFESTPAVPTPGGGITLHWRVMGSRPMTLEIHSTNGSWTNVTNHSSISAVAPAHDHERLLLRARNSVGSDSRELYLGVGMDLQIWPGEATIAPGARQRLEVRNADGVQWEAGGGEIVDMQGVYAFRAEEPGTYTLTARTDFPVERRASITIEVVEQKGRPTIYRGLGGQIGTVNGWTVPSPVVDADGSLLLAGGYRYRPDSDTWFMEKESLSNLQMTPDGRLFGTRGNTLLIRSSTGDFEPVATGWDPEQHIDALRPGGDGSLLALVRKPSYGHPRRLWIISPDGTSSQVDLPGDLSALAAATGADGTLVVAAEVELGAPAAIFMKRPEEEWTDLGTLPQITDRLYDLLYTSSGKIFVAGRRLVVWEEGAWTEWEEGLPACQEGHLCGVFDLHERQHGTILAVSKTAVHELGPDGVFRRFGQPSPWMDSKTTAPGAMRAIAEVPDGTFYLVGDTGVFFLLPGSDQWSIAGDRGLPPNQALSDLLIEPDGSLLVTGGGWGGQPGSHSLFRRQAGTSRWTGLGDDIGTPDFPDAVQRLMRDRDGNLYGWADGVGAFKINLQGGRSELLPRAGFTGEDRDIVGFVAAPDRSLYVATRDQVFRLVRGAQRWASFSGIPCPRALVQTPGGGLWAATCWGPVKLAEGTNWSRVIDGLPLEFVGNFEARDLTAASDGRVLLASDKGTFQLPPGGQRWQRLGVGEASVQSRRITSGGGRTWVISGDAIYELAESGSWLKIDAMPPLSLHDMGIFQATPQGTLLLTGAGLVEAVDRLQ